MAKNNQVSAQSDAMESAQVRRDLIFVISLNVVFFAALIALYFVNRSSGSVDSFFGRLLHF